MYMYVTVPALYYVNSVSFEFSLFNKKKEMTSEIADAYTLYNKLID